MTATTNSATTRSTTPQTGGMIGVTDEQVNLAPLHDRAPSVGAMFRRRVEATPDAPAYQYFADPASDDLMTLTWRQTHDQVEELAAGLIALGIGIEDRVAIASTTRMEWILADLAICCAGGATTTVYPTTISDDVAYILSDSGSRILFAEDAGQLAKVRERRQEVGGIEHVVLMTGELGAAEQGGAEQDGHEQDGAEQDGWVMTMAQLASRGREALAADAGMVGRRIDELGPDNLAVVIYTSGTTGRPKGVRLAQDSVVYEGAVIEAVGALNKDDVQLLWLPLSHVFGKMLVSTGIQLGFVTAVDGRVEKLVDIMGIVRPTFMAGPPRAFEKIRGRVGMMLGQETGAKKKIIDWGIGVGREVAQLREAGRQPTGVLAVKAGLADKLVLAKVKDRFGGRIRFMVSGSAPLNEDVQRWFASVGLRVVEGYGLTETSSGTTVNRDKDGHFKLGTVGWPLPETEVRIAEDGEVLVKGPGVMRGYHNNPEATAAVLTDDGWFSTGDIGEIDERGFLRITDRKKDFFKTSGGKFIAPSAIEAKMKGMCPFISQFLVEGAGHNYATALVALDPDAITAWASGQGLAGKSYEEIVGSPQARALVQQYVEELNAGLNRWETIKKFTILPRDLTIEEGDLTPSMKLKRRVVADKFQSEITAMYAGD